MPPTPLTISDLGSLLGLVENAPLESSSLDSRPLTAPFEQQRTVALGQLPSVAVDAHSGLQISLFNSVDDKDPDRILMRSGNDAFGDVAPPVTLSADRAWIKYRIEGGLSASGDPDAGRLRPTLGVAASASAVLTDYRIHDRSEKLTEAISADLKEGTRLASVLSDVESLAPGEAVSVQLGGTLKLEVKVSWADMFVGELRTLAAVTQLRQPIALQFDAGATLTAQISVDDDFIVVFSRASDTTWRVSVRKADTRTLGARLNAGVDVSLAGDTTLGPIVDTVLEQLAGDVAGRIGPLLPKNSLDDVRNKVSSMLEDVVRTKLSAAFTYEYRRVTTTSDVLQATLSASALRAYHDALVRGDMQPALSGILEHQPGIALDRYLHENSIQRTHTWGFTLGIGKWISLGATDSRTIAPVIRFDIDGNRQESYLGLRSYDARGVTDEISWSGEFKAEMDAFSREPLLGQFSLGIHLMWRLQPKHLSDNDIDVFLDAAVIWGVMTANDAAGIRASLSSHKGRPCDATVQIVLSDDDGQSTLRRTLEGTRSTAPITTALGEAMPWRTGSIGRTQPLVRRNLYAPLWDAYFRNPDTSPSALAASASTFLTDQRYPDLGRLELQFRDLRPYTFAGLAELNANTPDSARSFVSALAALLEALDANEPAQPTLDQVFRGLSGFWAQSLHIRAAGVYLLEAARGAGIFDRVKRTATFEVDGTAIVLG